MEKEFIPQMSLEDLARDSRVSGSQIQHKTNIEKNETALKEKSFYQGLLLIVMIICLCVIGVLVFHLYR